MPHAVGQVFIENSWHSTDGYVVDPVLFARAKEMLRDSRQACGWGIVADATGHWDGQRNCLQQYQESDVLQIYGVFHDPSQFYSSASYEPAQGWRSRVKYEIGASLVNWRVAQIRRAQAKDRW